VPFRAKQDAKTESVFADALSVPVATAADFCPVPPGFNSDYRGLQLSL